MPLLTQGKTNWKFILIVLILAAIVGGVMWFLSTLTPEASLIPGELVIPEEETPKETEDETADWLTYRNEEYGFEMKYPEDLFASSEPPEIRVYDCEYSDFCSGHEIEIANNVSFCSRWFPEEEGAAGSQYTRLYYTIFKDGECLDLVFHDRFSKCGPRELDPGCVKGLEERSKIVDQKIPSTFRFIEEEEMFGPPCDDLSDCSDFNCPQHGHPDCNYDLECSGGYCICVPICLP